MEIPGACPLDCPDGCSWIVTVRRRRGGRAARQPRPPVHARGAVREGRALPRPHARARPAAAPAAPGRREGRGAVRADLLGRRARRDRRAAARRARAPRRRGDLAVRGDRDARLPPGAGGTRRRAALERARRQPPHPEHLLDRRQRGPALHDRHEPGDGPGGVRTRAADPAVGLEPAHEPPPHLEVHRRRPQGGRAPRRDRPRAHAQRRAGRRAHRAAPGHGRRAGARADARGRPPRRARRGVPARALRRLGRLPRADRGVHARARRGDLRPPGRAHRRARRAARDHAADRDPHDDGHPAARGRRDGAAHARDDPGGHRRLDAAGRRARLLHQRLLPRRPRRAHARRPAPAPRPLAADDADRRRAARRRPGGARARRPRRQPARVQPGVGQGPAGARRARTCSRS